MTRLRVASYGISLDGYGAGPDQSLANPLGVGGMALHDWVFATRTFQRDVRARRAAAPASTTTSPHAGFDEYRRLDPRSQHVRAGARPVAGRKLEGLVGREAALSLSRSSCSPIIPARRWR